MIAETLKTSLKTGIVSFSYKKKNGEWREAIGTRMLPYIDDIGGAMPNGRGQERPAFIAYYDIVAQGWRSCKNDSIIAINKFWELEEWKEVESEVITSLPNAPKNGGEQC
jgi:hypothetical protein